MLSLPHCCAFLAMSEEEEDEAEERWAFDEDIDFYNYSSAEPLKETNIKIKTTYIIS